MRNHCIVLIKDAITEFTFEKICLAVKKINYFELSAEAGEAIRKLVVLQVRYNVALDYGGGS